MSNTIEGVMSDLRRVCEINLEATVRMSSPSMLMVLDKADSLRAERDAFKAEVEKLAKFKAYVHERLDAAGVPTDPESPHKAKGCRIGGRLDFVFAEAVRLRANLDTALQQANKARAWGNSEYEARLQQTARASQAEAACAAMRALLQDIRYYNLVDGSMRSIVVDEVLNASSAGRDMLARVEGLEAFVRHVIAIDDSRLMNPATGKFAVTATPGEWERIAKAARATLFQPEVKP